MLLLAAGVTTSAAGEALRVGYEVPFQAESPHPYPAGPGSTPVWSVAVDHPGATYLALHFQRFELGPGDRVVIRSEDARQRHVLTGRGRHQLGTFWAPHIKGDRTVVELFSPGRGPGGWGVSLDLYAAGYPDAGTEPGFEPEAVCGTNDRRNIICYADSEPDAYDRSRAVARLLINGQLLCTGWLVGCEGHFITNNHCIDSPDLSVDPLTAVQNTDYEFMAEAPSCTSANGQLWWGGTFWTGTPTLVQRDFGLDYAYIHLAGNPQDTYGAFLLEDRASMADERIYIPQHSAGFAKEFGLESTDPTDESGYCEVTLPNSGIQCTGGGPGDMSYQCDSRGGSSGAPVVSYDSHQVIGLHHCSLASGQTPVCPNLGVPIQSVITHLGTNLPACAVAFDTDLAYETHLVDDTLGNGNGAAEPFEILTLPVEIRNVGTRLGTGITGTLSTTTPGITVLDPSADWPSVPAGSVRVSVTPHFEARIADDVPCGTVIDFDLALSTDQGPFALAFQQTVGVDQTAAGAWPASDTPLAVPDRDRDGVVSGLAVAQSFSIADVTVSVDITHARIGDLEVDLTSPGGTTVRLHDRTGGDADDLVTTYPTPTLPDGPGSLSDFDGENLAGTWQLKVADRVNGEVGTLNGWSLSAQGVPEATCEPVPCRVTAVAEVLPSAAVCDGEPITLSGAASSEFGQDCSGTLEFQFKLFSSVLQAWSQAPDLEIVPTSEASYTVQVRDQATLAEDVDYVPVTVLAAATAAVTQSPDPMCVEVGSAGLDGGAGFASYQWRDDTGLLVGGTQVLALDGSACGRTYSLEVTAPNGCGDTAAHVVNCEPCQPAEVSPPGAAVPFRLGLDPAGTVEFELLPDPGVTYHLYQADDLLASLAGDWSRKICDLAAGSSGTWTPVDAATVRWTPIVPGLIFEGYWVVVAESRSVEGPYGTVSGGFPRTPDNDGLGSLLSVGCP